MPNPRDHSGYPTAGSDLADGTYPAGCAGCTAPLPGHQIVLRHGQVVEILKGGRPIADTRAARRVSCPECGRENDVVDEATVSRDVELPR